MDENTPQYKLLADTFVAPRKLLAGSIIATNGPPGQHMEPMNDAARERMEAWYNEEHPTLDKNGDQNFEKTYKPHAIFRYSLPEEVEVHEVHVQSGPSTDFAGEVSLAESMYTKAPTDQRPGPAPVAGAEAQAIKDQSGVEVKAAAAETDPRKAGVKVS